MKNHEDDDEMENENSNNNEFYDGKFNQIPDPGNSIG